MQKVTLAILAVIALFASCAVAWGPEGHAVVATIAQGLIKQKTWQAIQAINGPGNSMASVASQPDAYDHTPGGRWSSPLHYVDMPAGSTHFSDGVADCPNEICVVGAIKNYTTRSAKLPKTLWPYTGESSQPSPVTFLIHFVGDVHQPLHVGWTSDRGGNTIKCTFFGRSTELHAVWDSGIIYHSGQDTNALATNLLAYIHNNPSVTSSWAAQTSVSAWADESFQLVRNQVYQFGSAASTMHLGDDYYNANWPTVQQRLAMAGVRLATLLDMIFQ